MRISDWSSDVCSSDLAATGEVISAEELGGADTHGRKSGVVDHVAENDEHALTIVRDIVSTLPANRTPDIALADPRPPRHPTEALYGIIPQDEIGRASGRERVCQYV